MDKFYVTPKKNSVSNNVSLRKSGANCRSSSEIFQTTTSSKRLAVGNICSKIRHKIEDNLTPKISGKLYKTAKHSKSLTALSSNEASIGKYTPTNKHSESVTAVTDCRKVNKSLNPYAGCYNISKQAFHFAKLSANQIVDSDEDEPQLSLDIANTSLEDEIFKELEKASQDEHKLKSVLNSFDKIIMDYNEPATATATEINKNSEEMKVTTTGNENLQLLKEHDAEHALCTPDENESLTPGQRKELAINALNAVEYKTNKPSGLQKSLSTLSLTRKKCYQSPDSPCLRQMRHAFAQQQRSKSVWELSKVTKIPILKINPLHTRSNSFSCANFENSKSREEFKVQKSFNISSTTRTDPVLKSDCILPIANKNSWSRESKKQEQTTQSNNNKLLGKIAGNSNFTPSAPKPLTDQKHNKTSDELLDKCLEKGQQILRKVESLKPQRVHNSSYARKTQTRTKSNAKNKISMENLANKRKEWLQKLNYANEDKIRTPALESCKIIPPVLGETSDKHAELLVQVTNAVQLMENKKSPASQKHQLPNVHKNTTENELLAKYQQSESDDSGHISNENIDNSSNHTSDSSSSYSSLCEISPISPGSACGNCVETKSLKMSEVLKKFELKLSGQPQTKSSNTNSTTASRTQPSSLQPSSSDAHSNESSLDPRFCVTCRLADVESVSLIRTHMEIYPNYTKEVTIRLR